MKHKQKNIPKLLFYNLLLLAVVVGAGCNTYAQRGPSEPIRTVEQWRHRCGGKPVEHLVCSGPGVLRLITLLDASEKVIAVEQMEHGTDGVAPYRRANPQYGELPIFGEGHGRDNVEVLLAMEPRPDVIIRMDNPGSGLDPAVLQERTGIPVVLIPYTDLADNLSVLEKNLLFLGEILDRQERAARLTVFIKLQINELKQRTDPIPFQERHTAFLGGLSYRGTHGLNSTTSLYPPFDWLNITNPAAAISNNAIGAQHIMVAPEQIIKWNPEFLFVDLGTLDFAGLETAAEVQTQAVFRSLDAVKSNQIYALYPNNSYGTNFVSLLVNAWFIGKTVYPEHFTDVNFSQKADEICRFMLNTTFDQMCPEHLKTRVHEKFLQTPPVQEH